MKMPAHLLRILPVFAFALLMASCLPSGSSSPTDGMAPIATTYEGLYPGWNPSDTTRPTMTVIPAEMTATKEKPTMSTRMKTATTEITKERQPTTALPTVTPIPSLAVGMPAALVVIRMFSEEEGWAVESAGHALHTTDAGKSWINASPGEQDYLFSFFDSSRAWAISKAVLPCSSNPCGTERGALVWRTNDGGRTWRSSELRMAAPMEYLPVAVSFITPDTGWIFVNEISEISNSSYWSIHQTRDGGRTWEFVSPGNSCQPIGLVFTDEAHGWYTTNCRGEGGVSSDPLRDLLDRKKGPLVYETLDGGRTWQFSFLPPPKDFPQSLQECPKVKLIKPKSGVERLGWRPSWNP